ncbi:hypothetical protein Cgig2_017109 [Carnegiea gigantea]|uniref:Uncharacterized protein n=1 Tax=Carnegiea gigantea TaxID=171969 RepID=A0A9Q1GVK5_9CARY|nr:hypothetical protein Cgig2_017109 [Carnegiea gigantea]
MTIAPITRQPVEVMKGTPNASGEQEATNSKKLKLTKEVLPEKHDEKCLGATKTPEKLEEVEPSDALKKREPLFDDCGNKEATRVSIATLKPRERLKMNVINIWSSILNDRERKRDLATPTRFFISCDQSVRSSHSTYCSIITTLVIMTEIISY